MGSGLPDLFSGAVRAVIFDLDGVITDTASVHFGAWKELFDTQLRAWAEANGTPFEAFTRDDYLAYVDGKPRYDGVRSFLRSRGVDLPEGTSDDPPDRQTVRGLGNRKNDLFLRVLDEQGVQVYPTSVELLGRLRDAGVATGCVSSSKSCRFVLDRVGLLPQFDAIVDGNDAVDRQLAGKPAPDTFVACAGDLGVEPGAAIVVEDAISGVAAGAAGGFAHVVGVDRGAGRERLLAGGATVVVTDLGEFLHLA